MRTEGRHRRLRTGAGVVAAAALAVVGGLAATEASASSSPATTHHHGELNITKKPFGSPVTDPYGGGPQQTFRYTLTNAEGVKINLLSYGAITQAIWVPDREGHQADVVLGFKTLNEYVTEASPPVIANGGPYFGETIGRYGNRIANGKFHLNGKTYTLPQNNGVNSLHGGLNGFGNHIWHQVGGLIKTGDQVGVTLRLVSPNGDESHPAGSPGCPSGCTGYPAKITVDVTFTLDNEGRYQIHYKVHNDSKTLDTVTNLTNHSYFNLAGEASGPAVNQLIKINADTYTPTDSGLIPLGTLNPVAGTPFDFRHFTRLGDNIDNCTTDAFSCNQLLTAHGLDHNWVLNAQTPETTGPEGLNLAARALDPSSGRELSVWTDQPGVQFYASNFLNGTLVGISGHTYRQTQAYTFETQHFPNSPNQHNFPSTVLKAGATFNTTTIFAFSSGGEH
ncbi:MAG: galactose mutarotase [Streptosporangiaceae bacterium]|nr:galactose mutarotase [Streptosporangiaceae bacterium]